MQTWTQDDIRTLLDNPNEGRNPKIIYRMLQAMTERQTQDEQISRATKHHNGIGFNGLDGTFLTDVAITSRQYGHLTNGQLRVVAKKLKKYSRQLAEIAAENIARKQGMAA